MEATSYPSESSLTWPLEVPGATGLVLHELRYPPGLDLAPHTHEGALVCVVLRGGYEETGGRRRLEAGPGAATFQPPAEAHANRVGQAGLHGLRLELGPPWLGRLPGLDGLGPALARGRAEWLARALLDEVSRGADSLPAAVESLALLILAEFRRSRDEAGIPPWLCRVRERLDEEHDRVPLSELAREADVHPAHLARAFARHYSSTVGEYGRERRLARARDLVLTTDRPLSEVAARCGFADQSHLGRAFRRRFGATPGALRRREPGRGG